MPLLVRIYTRLQGQEIDSAYSLGRLGMFFNVAGLLYLVFAIITFNFPSVYPVTAGNMNYTCAAVGVSVLIAAGNWFIQGKRQYTGPQRGGVLHGSTPSSVTEDVQVAHKPKTK